MYPRNVQGKIQNIQGVVLYYLWLQACTEGLGSYPPIDKGECYCVSNLTYSLYFTMSLKYFIVIFEKKHHCCKSPSPQISTSQYNTFYTIFLVLSVTVPSLSPDYFRCHKLQKNSNKEQLLLHR